MSTDPTQTQFVAKMNTELEALWRKIHEEIRSINPQTENFKVQGQGIPQARIRKIMKLEEFLKSLEDAEQREAQPDAHIKQPPKFMISQEAPALMAKACELIVRELTTRAWQHTERNRRRTLTRSDIHAAVGDSDVFDFLIDIVPRVASVYRAPPTSAMDPHLAMQGMVVQPPAEMMFPPPPMDPNVGNMPPMGYSQQMQQQQMHDHTNYMQMHGNMDGNQGIPDHD